MRLIITGSIEKKGKEIGLSFDDIYDFIKDHRPHSFQELCSPLSGTTAYKGYINNLDRIVVFFTSSLGLIYPVYIGDKNDDIAKNITVSKVRQLAQLRQEKILDDIKNKKIKIRHF